MTEKQSTPAAKADPNRMPGEGTPIEIGGVTRHLLFNNRAQFLYKHQTGESFARGLLAIGEDGCDAEVLTHLIWAGRSKFEPGLEIETVMDELQPSEYLEYTRAIIDAVGAAMPWMLDAEAAKKKLNGTLRGSTRGRNAAPGASTKKRTGTVRRSS